MKKYIILIGLLSFSVFARTPDEAIKEVELNKNAKCTRVSSSGFGVKLNNARLSKIKFNCVSATDEFRVVMSVERTIIGDSYSELRVLKTRIKN